MPIDLNQFEEGSAPDAERGSSVRPQVEKFLQENKGTAYTTREIADQIEANRATVNHTVRKLTEEGLVDRKKVNGLIYNVWVGAEAGSE